MSRKLDRSSNRNDSIDDGDESDDISYEPGKIEDDEDDDGSYVPESLKSLVENAETELENLMDDAVFDKNGVNLHSGSKKKGCTTNGRQDENSVQTEMPQKDLNSKNEQRKSRQIKEENVGAITGDDKRGLIMSVGKVIVATFVLGGCIFFYMSEIKLPDLSQVTPGFLFAHNEFHVNIDSEAKDFETTVDHNDDTQNRQEAPEKLYEEDIPGPDTGDESFSWTSELQEEDLQYYLGTPVEQEKLERLISQRPDLLNKPDRNGWYAIHEAAYAGNLELLSIIFSSKSMSKDLINVRVGKDGNGGNALWLARQVHEHDHPAVRILEENGCMELAPLHVSSNSVNNDQTTRHQDVQSEEGENKQNQNESFTEEVEITFNVMRQVSFDDEVMFERYIRQRPDLLNETDENGWHILHEVSRAGNAVSLAIIFAADVMNIELINARCGKHGDGGNALWLARHFHGEDHPAVRVLEENGVMELAPEPRLSNDNDQHQFERDTEEMELTYIDLVDVLLKGDGVMFERYIRQRPDLLNETDENGWHILHEAARAGEVTFVKIILASDAMHKSLFNARYGVDGDGGNALWLARHFHGEDHPVVHALEKNWCIELAPGDGLPVEVDFTPEDVRLAAARGETKLLEEYIRQRPSWLQKPDINGWLPLHEAARAGEVDSLALILAYGVDLINARVGKDGDEGNALWLSKKQHGSDHPVIKLLEKNGCVELAPGDGLPVEVDFTSDQMRHAATSGNIELLKNYIRQRPSWLNEPDENGWLIIHEVSLAGQVDSLATIISSSVFDKESINFSVGKNGDGGNALWWVSHGFDSDHPVVQLLVENGGVEVPPIKSEL